MRNEAGAFTPGGLDALPPAEVARKAETVGVTKAWMAGLDVFVLSVLAGAVRRVALLPGRAGRGGLVLGVEVWRRGHAGIEALGLASNQSPDA